MIPEPDRYGSQPIRKRNNNLLCVAIILFIVGISSLQMAWFIIVWWNYISSFDPLFLIVLLLIGIVPTLGGIYVMWRWWNSGS
jgi:hypothetical protein